MSTSWLLQAQSEDNVTQVRSQHLQSATSTTTSTTVQEDYYEYRPVELNNIPLPTTGGNVTGNPCLLHAVCSYYGAYLFCYGVDVRVLLSLTSRQGTLGCALMGAVLFVKKVVKDLRIVAQICFSFGVLWCFLTGFCDVFLTEYYDGSLSGFVMFVLRSLWVTMGDRIVSFFI